MKARSAQSAKRAAVVGVAALGAVSLLGGCGFETRQQAAAVVNGEVIQRVRRAARRTTSSRPPSSTSPRTSS